MRRKWESFRERRKEGGALKGKDLGQVGKRMRLRSVRCRAPLDLVGFPSGAELNEEIDLQIV